MSGLGNKLATIVEVLGTDGMALVQYGKVRVRVNISNMRVVQSSDMTVPLNSQPPIKKHVCTTEIYHKL